jgi:hypothetical protein
MPEQNKENNNKKMRIQGAQQGLKIYFKLSIRNFTGFSHYPKR